MRPLIVETCVTCRERVVDALGSQCPDCERESAPRSPEPWSLCWDEDDALSPAWLASAS